MIVQRVVPALDLVLLQEPACNATDRDVVDLLAVILLRKTADPIVR